MPEKDSTVRLLSDKEIDSLLYLSLAEMDRDIRDSVLMMCFFQPSTLEEAPFGATYEGDGASGHILVLYDRDQIDAIYAKAKREGIADYVVRKTIAKCIEHELWHIMLGDIFDADLMHRYSNNFEDPLFLMAVEIRINEGCLGGPNDILHPLITFKNLGIEDHIRAYVYEHHLPNDWLFDLDTVYSALASTLGAVRRKVHVEYRNGAPVAVVVTETVTHPDGRVEEVQHRIPISRMPQANNTGYPDGRMLMLRIRDGNTRLHYDPEKGHIVRSDVDPCIHSAFHVQWSRLIAKLDIHRTTGWNRRIGHLYPKGQSRLVCKRKKMKSIHVFIDSSGSIDGELLSQFVNIVRRSPYQVQVHYFHTEVTEQPVSGGTHFACIEEYLRSLPRYPDVVAVLTDGQDLGPEFHPLHPKRWYWIVYGDDSIPRRIGGVVLPVKKLTSRV